MMWRKLPKKRTYLSAWSKTIRIRSRTAGYFSTQSSLSSACWLSAWSSLSASCFMQRKTVWLQTSRYSAWRSKAKTPINYSVGQWANVRSSRRYCLRARVISLISCTSATSYCLSASSSAGSSSYLLRWIWQKCSAVGVPNWHLFTQVSRQFSQLVESWLGSSLSWCLRISTSTVQWHLECGSCSWQLSSSSVATCSRNIKWTNLMTQPFINRSWAAGKVKGVVICC